MELAAVREDLVDGLEHESKGVVESEAVSVALRSVPREEFVAEERAAYADRSFEHAGTRVLAPSTVARLVEALALNGEESVLVVGAGVGYSAAVIAEIVGEHRVHAVDIARRLVIDARANLAAAGYGGVLVDRRDGARGLPEYAPFDRVLLEAAVIHPPRALCEQVAPDGRLVYPAGGRGGTLVAIHDPARAIEVARGSLSETDAAEPRGPIELAPMLIEGEQSSTLERNRTTREDREHARRGRDRRHGWEHDWIDWDAY